MIYSLDSVDVKNKTVFIRVDFNVPIENGVIVDDTRIVAALPSIKYCLENNAKIILASHLGRPKGLPNPKYSMAPVRKRLEELLNLEVKFATDCIGSIAEDMVKELQPSSVLLLENLRFYSEEEKNNAEFAKKLSHKADVYINDAFGAIHRAHASVSAITSFIPVKCAGFLVSKEISSLSKLLSNTEKPFIAILGGAKVSDKIKVIENLLNVVDGILIGGAMAYTFLSAKGIGMGNSLVESDKLELARDLLKKAQDRNVDILLPVDHIIARSANIEDEKPQNTDGEFIPDLYAGFDIGLKTLDLFSSYIKNARSVFWNGPMGLYENKLFSNGTLEIAKLLSIHTGFTVVGGGDSAAALSAFNLSDKVCHVSTGGGASLEFLEGVKLPGIASLEVSL